MGLRYSPGSFVNCEGFPPELGIVQSCPCLPSSQLAKTTVEPSGDQEGENSLGVKESAVSRFGDPSDRVMIHSLPTAGKRRQLPSGEAVCQRIIFGWKGPSSIGSGDHAISEMVR